MTETTIGDLTITTAKIGGRALTIGKVRQFDYAEPTTEIEAIARYKDPKDSTSYGVRVIGIVGGRTVRSFAVPTEHFRNYTWGVSVVNPELHAAWSDLPLVIL